MLNQLKNAGHQVQLSPSGGDFLVDEQYVLEVGRREKTPKQIVHLPEGYLALDEIEEGLGPRIPLWLFGFMY